MLNFSQGFFFPEKFLKSWLVKYLKGFVVFLKGICYFSKSFYFFKVIFKNSDGQISEELNLRAEKYNSSIEDKLCGTSSSNTRGRYSHASRALSLSLL